MWLISSFQLDIQEIIDDIKAEFATTEPNLEIILEAAEMPETVMDVAAQEAVLRAIYAAHNGVYLMSAEMPDLVETSNNIAKVIIENGQLSVQCLTRSSVETSKYDLANALKSAFELAGCEVLFSGSYPGWKPKPDAEIVQLLAKTYTDLFGEEPRVVACHAGLECGILGKNYPNMDMVSFGPTILGAHSPDERASITSVQKFWKLFCTVLEHIPEKVSR